MQENSFSVFFKMRNYLTKFFLICEIFFDFFNKYMNKRINERNCSEKVQKTLSKF